MWLCDECGDGGRGGFAQSRDALHGHMSDEAHFTGWISYGGPCENQVTVQVHVVATEEGVFFRHEPFPDPGRAVN